MNLECSRGSQAEQTASILMAFEKELLAYPTDLFVVAGDVTSAMACAIVAHLEVGIRLFDLTMLEEINRMVTDSITDYIFATYGQEKNTKCRTHFCSGVKSTFFCKYK